MKENVLENFARNAVESLKEQDPVLYHLLEREHERQMTSLTMVASCTITHPSVLACEGTFASNVTAEGYPGGRFHAGCEFIDQFEQLAIDRAKKVFGAQYANVQPHTASTANQIVCAAILKPHDTLMGMQIASGGHLSHGAKVNISGTFFNSVGYGLNEKGFIDFVNVAELARQHRPKLIICGTTAYPRTVDWQRFRDIADEVGAYLLADITHIAGLVIAGVHPNPIDIAHFTVTCTHKQLYGPRGGLIMMGREWDTPAPTGKGTLSNMIRRSLFPFIQGAPIPNTLVAKARTLDRAGTEEFRQLAKRIVTLSRALAAAFVQAGVEVVSGGTDNHIVLVDVFESFGLTGIVAEKALEECGIIVNKNFVPNDPNKAFVTSGIRIGTNALAERRFGPEQMEACADLICRILKSTKGLGEREYELDPGLRDGFREEVRALCRQFPIPGY